MLSFVNFGMIGFGEHARKILGSFSRTSIAKLISLGTRHPEKAELVHRKWPHITVCDSYQAVLSNADVQAVLIALPNHLHAEWIEQSLEAGKHVLCEKPLCLEGSTARRLSGIASAKGLLLAETFYYRLHPQHVAAKAILESGVLGALERIEAQYHYTLRDPGNFRTNPAAGGGVLSDAGCYGVDSARFYFGCEPAGASGELRAERDGVDRYASFALRFSGDREATITCSMDRAREHSLRLICSKGMLTLPQAFHVQAGEKVSLVVETSGGPRSFAPQPPDDQIARFADRFARAVLDGTALPAPLEDGVRNMEALDRIRAACRITRDEKPL